jgi:chromosomal replication initiation ATPase DnaA
LTKQERDAALIAPPTANYWAIPGLKYKIDFQQKTTFEEGMLKAKRMAHVLHIPFLKVTGKGRLRKYVLPRQAIMYVLRKNTDLKLEEIAKMFGRDHTTVMHSIKAIEGLIQNEPSVLNMVDFLRNAV